MVLRSDRITPVRGQLKTDWGPMEMSFQFRTSKCEASEGHWSRSKLLVTLCTVVILAVRVEVIWRQDRCASPSVAMKRWMACSPRGKCERACARACAHLHAVLRLQQSKQRRASNHWYPLRAKRLSCLLCWGRVLGASNGLKSFTLLMKGQPGQLIISPVYGE